MSDSRPHRRPLGFRKWSEVFADVEGLHHNGYIRTGNWDLSQVLDHVGEGLRTAVGGSPHQAAWIIRKWIGPFILRKILRERRMKAGIKVPQWWLPGPSKDESEAIAKFKGDVKRFEDLKSSPFPHPFFGTMTKEQWNELAIIHAGHHLSFLIPNGCSTDA